MNDLHDLELLLQSRVPLLVIETRDEYRVTRLFAKLAEGFSGAEIEQSIVAALYLAREQQTRLDTGHIRSEIETTRPLSRVMVEKIDYLRAWAQNRTVLAN